MRSKYIYWVVIFFIVVSVDVLSTFFVSPTLSYENSPGNNFVYEENRLVGFLDMGWWGLIVVLYGFWFLNSLLFFYHCFLYKPIHYSQIRQFGLSKLLKKDFKFLVFYLAQFLFDFWVYYQFFTVLFNRLGIILSNFLLGFFNRNATVIVNGENIDVKLNNSPLWDSFVGDWVLKYVVDYLIKSENKFLHYYYFLIVSVLVIAMFVLQAYKEGRSAKVLGSGNPLIREPSTDFINSKSVSLLIVWILIGLFTRFLSNFGW